MNSNRNLNMGISISDGLRGALELSFTQFRKLSSENIDSIKNLITSNKRNANRKSKLEATTAIAKNSISVLYTLNDQYHHVVCSSYEEADKILQTLIADEKRNAVGIYNSATNHFDWEMTGQYQYDLNPLKGIGEVDEKVISIVNALRRKDSSWSGEFNHRPSLFA